jgi:hypothetical protein
MAEPMRDAVVDAGRFTPLLCVAAVAARLAALRDEHIDAALGRLDRLPHRRDLQHHTCPYIVRLPAVISFVLGGGTPWAPG